MFPRNFLATELEFCDTFQIDELVIRLFHRVAVPGLEYATGCGPASSEYDPGQILTWQVTMEKNLLPSASRAYSVRTLSHLGSSVAPNLP